ncbi:MAG: single-stranded DNA-binding protein [Eggerthellaceae bacterium]|jgi:hypothetical protein|nr:single-stranded DNA-binding protein [Eggerthellaceae bacterium]MDR2715382.1 single-stranded DNA-binding protein [Coriobacteriaceae bacterium]
MSRVVQISFSDTEYSEIEAAANDAGISIAQYAKDRILADGEFLNRYKELLDAVSTMRDETKFNIKAVFGLQWASIPKGLRLGLGREFYKQVAAGTVANVKPTVKDAANTQWYIKKEV